MGPLPTHRSERKGGRVLVVFDQRRGPRRPHCAGPDDDGHVLHALRTSQYRPIQSLRGIATMSTTTRLPRLAPHKHPKHSNCRRWPPPERLICALAPPFLFSLGVLVSTATTPFVHALEGAGGVASTAQGYGRVLRVRATKTHQTCLKGTNCNTKKFNVPLALIPERT